MAAPEQFAEKVLDWINAGAKMVSGCCGTTPQHIEKMVERMRALPSRKA